MKNNLKKNKDFNISQLIFEKFVEKDNNKILSIMKKLLYIYDKHLKLKKLKYFFEFYRKAMKKKEKSNRIKIHDKLVDIMKRRQKIKNNLEKIFDEKEEEKCTFSPKINKNSYLNINQSFKPQYCFTPPIIIIPTTSRIYFPDGKNKNIKFGEILQNFIEKSSTIALEGNKTNKSIKKNDSTKNGKIPSYIFDYTGKTTFKNTSNKNITLEDNIHTNNKRNKKKEDNYNSIDKENYKTFREKRSFNSLFDIHKTKSFSKIDSSKNRHFRDMIKEIPRQMQTSKYFFNERINRIYLNNFSKKNYNKTDKYKKRKIQLIKQKQKQRLNTLNTNNETKGYSASTLSTRDIQNIRSNSKRESSYISNYTSHYKTKNYARKKRISNGFNKTHYTKNETNMTLQSLSDSKMMELAENFIDKKIKDDLLDDIGIKKILVFNSSKNGNKGISFSGEK